MTAEVTTVKQVPMYVHTYMEDPSHQYTNNGIQRWTDTDGDDAYMRSKGMASVERRPHRCCIRWSRRFCG